MRTIRLASADPAGIAHDPAVSFFVDRVAKLSNGRLRIAVDERRAPGHEKQLLLDVAGGWDDLGWAHTSSFEEVGVRSFDALDAPMLVDGYRIERAVLRSSLAAQMLAGTRSVGLDGLALLSGPLSRLVGVGQAVRTPEDLRHLSFGVHGVITGKSRIPPTTAVLATRALRAFRVPMFHDFVEALYTGSGGGAAAFEDDLDTLFFDRYGGACGSEGPGCGALDPWVTANVVLWPRTAVPRRESEQAPGAAGQRACVDREGRVAGGGLLDDARLPRRAATRPRVVRSGCSLRDDVAARRCGPAARAAEGLRAARAIAANPLRDPAGRATTTHDGG
jgi:hypothetical protein